MNVVQKLRQLVTDIPRQPAKASDHFALASRLLRSLPADQAKVERACAGKDLSALDEIVAALEGIASKPAAPPPNVPQERMDAALKAFRKRLKLGRLADESRLGGRYTSGGRASNIDAIIPPDDFPPEVWKALEHAGKLKHTGQGFYAEV